MKIKIFKTPYVINVRVISKLKYVRAPEPLRSIHHSFIGSISYQLETHFPQYVKRRKKVYCDHYVIVASIEVSIFPLDVRRFYFFKSIFSVVEITASIFCKFKFTSLI